MPFRVSFKRGRKGYIKVLFVQSHDCKKSGFDIEEYFHQKGMRIRRQKAPDIFSAKILNIDLISEIQLSNSTNISCSCVSAAFLDMKNAERRLT